MQPPRDRTSPDPALVQGCRKGDRRDLETLVERNLPVLFSFFRTLSVPFPSVEDLIQETFAKAIQNFDRYDPSRPFTSWLLTIARNTLIDERRRSGRVPHPADSADMAAVTHVEEEVVRRDSVEQLLSALSEEEKSLIELKVFARLSFPEIAEVTGGNETTLRVRFFRIMRRLRISGAKNDDDQA